MQFEVKHSVDSNMSVSGVRVRESKCGVSLKI